MKLDNITGESGAEAEPPPVMVVGDLIGSTVYSERFVLRLLLKFAHLSDDPALEEEFCILWDMSAEPDVVRFLIRHHFIEHTKFAWPELPNERLAEIFLGILGNMCCQPAAAALLRADLDFCNTIVGLVHSHDAALLIQVLRLIKACLFEVEADEVKRWLDRFYSVAFSQRFGNIMCNSKNKNLLLTSLEAANTICSAAGPGTLAYDDFHKFATIELLQGLCICVRELKNSEHACSSDEFDRCYLVALSITIALLEFNIKKDCILFHISDKLCEVNECKESITDMLAHILEYYRIKMLEDKDFDDSVLDTIEAVTIISVEASLYGHYAEELLCSVFKIWSSLCSEKACEHASKSEFEPFGENKEFIDKLNKKSSKFVSTYLLYVYHSEGYFNNALKIIGDDLNEILRSVQYDTELYSEVSLRIQNYKNDHVDVDGE